MMLIILMEPEAHGELLQVDEDLVHLSDRLGLHDLTAEDRDLALHGWFQADRILVHLERKAGRLGQLDAMVKVVAQETEVV